MTFTPTTGLLALLLVFSPWAVCAAQSPKAATPAAEVVNKPAGRPQPTVFLEVRTDRPTALYLPGETITYNITAWSAKRQANAMIKDKNATPVAGVALRYTLKRDGVVLEQGEVTSQGNPVVVTTQAGRPGFYQCHVQEKTVTSHWQYHALGGAAVEPEKIQAGAVMPADFNDYWAKSIELLNKIDFTNAAAVRSDTLSKPDVDVYDVTIPSFGAGPEQLYPVVTGYLTKPVGAGVKSLPAIIRLPGAGIRSPSPASHDKTAMVLTISVHGLASGQSDDYYREKRDIIQSFYKQQFASKEQALEHMYFRTIILRVIRGLQYLQAQPEWDGKTLIVAGGSQGGGLSLIAAGLYPQVTACLASYPGFCDQYGYLQQRDNGWPGMIKLDKQGKPVDALAVETAAYFDAANFARNIKIDDIALSIGFIDIVCPPGSIYAAYNLIPTTHKQITHGPTNGHEGPRWDIQGFINRHIEKMKKTEQP